MSTPVKAPAKDEAHDPSRAATREEIKVAEEQVPAYVTVTYGYGKVRKTAKVWLENYLALGGIIRHVPIEKAQAWLKDPVYRKAIKIHLNDATEAEIAKACGVQAAQPKNVANQLIVSDLAQVAAEMDPEEVVRIIQELTSSLPASHPLRGGRRR